MQVLFFSLKSQQFVICRHGLERKEGWGDSGSETIFYCSDTGVIPASQFYPIAADCSAIHGRLLEMKGYIFFAAG